MINTILSPIIPIFCFLLLLVPHSCLGLSAPSSTALDFATVRLASTGPSQLAIVDGGEWSTVQSLLQKEGRLPKRTATKRGYMKIVTGQNENGERVIGMQESLGDPTTVFEDSVATIPTAVSDKDAIATYISALSAIHCALPQVKAIGGSDDTAMINRKAVVLGSNPLACFAAEGLASLGLEVSLVSMGNPKMTNGKVGKRKYRMVLSRLGPISMKKYLSSFWIIFRNDIRCGS